MRDAPAVVLGPLRTLISVAFLAVLLWGAFAIKLGDRTFADHMDRIGETEEAKALLDGARARVGPALEEVKQRLMGEYVEAPTYVPAAPPPRSPAVVTARAGQASTEESGRLPGRRVVPGALVEASDRKAKPRSVVVVPGSGESPAKKPRLGSAEVVGSGESAAKKAKPGAVEVVAPAVKRPRPGSADGKEPKQGAAEVPVDAGKLPGRRTSR